MFDTILNTPHTFKFIWNLTDANNGSFQLGGKESNSEDLETIRSAFSIRKHYKKILELIGLNKLRLTTEKRSLLIFWCFYSPICVRRIRILKSRKFSASVHPNNISQLISFRLFQIQEKRLQWSPAQINF